MALVDLRDAEVRTALTALLAKLSNGRPVLQAIGEDIVDRAKQRFGSGIGPDGRRWQANSQATIEAFIRRHRGFGKRGINKKGMAAAMSKRPLIGETGDLQRQFHVDVADRSVIIGNSMIYAAMQHWGGTKARFPHLWGDIPARPALPITPDGDLYPYDRAKILVAINDYLAKH